MSFLSRVSHCFSSLSLSLSSRHTLHLSSSQFSLASPLRLHRKRFARRRTMKSSRLSTLVPFCSSAAEHCVADSGANPSTSSPVQEDEGRHFLTIKFILSDFVYWFHNFVVCILLLNCLP